MRLIVLDTNVLVSAGLKPGGAPAVLMMDWILEGTVQLVTSPRIVAEYRDVTRRPKFQRYGFPPMWLEFVIQESLQLPDAPGGSLNCPDPNDLPFLALAHQTDSWLITGNLRHFPEDLRDGVRVLSPAAYLAHLMNDEP